MKQIIYVEDEIKDHPNTIRILERYKNATIIPCERYGEIFNRKAQSFRLQKQNPALILAKKHRNLILESPPEYGIGGQHNYYFSHMLNCIYDCRYCFLQGMYRSANYVVFVNYEDFSNAIINKTNSQPEQDSWFFSGYDGDSLAYEPVTQFLDHFIPLFKKLPQAWLELRTKSTQISALLNTEALTNCVVAFSFTPDNISRQLEQGVPSLKKRIDAMRRLSDHGWKLGLRFDPLIFSDDFRNDYQALFKTIFSQLPTEAFHSVSLGAMRLPKPFFNTMQKMFPEEKLFAGPFSDANSINMKSAKKTSTKNSLISYHPNIERDLLDFCTLELLKYIPEEIFFPCSEISNETNYEAT